MSKSVCLRTSATAFAIATSAICLPGAALAEPREGYIGITGGGPIAAGDRVATDDLKDVAVDAQISSENEIVSASFALEVGFNGNARAAKGGKEYTVSSYNLSLKASVPLNKAEDKAPIDFKTFGNDGKLTIGFNSYRAKFSDPFDKLPDLTQFAGGCILKAGKDWSKSSEFDQETVDRAIAEFNDPKTGVRSISGRLDAVRQLTKDDPEGGFGKIAYEFCRIGGGAQVSNDDQYVMFAAATIGAPQARSWRRKHYAAQGTFFWGGEASLGYNRFSVLDRGTLTNSINDRVGFDVNGRAGWIFGGAGTMVVLSVGYARSYEAKDVVEVCGPPDLSGNSRCEKGQDGLPKREDTAYGTASLRQVLLRNDKGQPILGIRPAVTYAFEDKAWQFELPVYLQRSESGGLDGGVRAIYNTGSKKFGIGAFIGVPF